VISDVLPDAKETLAFRWTALDNRDTTIRAFINLNRAKNWTEFTAALRDYKAPMQNFVYADVDGNIGFYAPGSVPIRRNGDGRMPVPGWTDEFEWIGYIPFEDLGYRARIRNHGHSCFLCEIVIRSQFHTTYEPEA
jgi:Protein related to penicillin acylase